MDNIFERAIRLKLRFVTNRGNLSAEDLWDLSEAQLDSIYASLAEHAQKQDVRHLMDASRVDDGTALRMAIVEHVFAVKQSEREDRATKELTREKFQRLLEIKARKQDAELEELDAAALDAKIAELESKL